jgi:hypothetical protein
MVLWLSNPNPNPTTPQESRTDRALLPVLRDGGGDRREHAVTPPGLADLATHREDRVGLQQRGILACKSLQDGGDTRDHGVTSCMMGVLIPIHTGHAWRTPTSTKPHEIAREFCLT